MERREGEGKGEKGAGIDSVEVDSSADVTLVISGITLDVSAATAAAAVLFMPSYAGMAMTVLLVSQDGRAICSIDETGLRQESSASRTEAGADNVRGVEYPDYLRSTYRTLHFTASSRRRADGSRAVSQQPTIRLSCPLTGGTVCHIYPSGRHLRLFNLAVCVHLPGRAESACNCIASSSLH